MGQEPDDSRDEIVKQIIRKAREAAFSLEALPGRMAAALRRTPDGPDDADPCHVVEDKP